MHAHLKAGYVQVMVVQPRFKGFVCEHKIADGGDLRGKVGSVNQIHSMYGSSPPQS